MYVETLGPMNEYAYLFFDDLGRRICDVTGDIQRLSVIIQRFNVALYRETLFCTTNRTSSHSVCF